MNRQISALVLLLIASPLAAHDFWIEPSTFRPGAGELVKLRLRVGENFRGQSLRRDPEHLRRFVVATKEHVSDVAGVAGSDPAGAFRYESGGATVIGYEGAPRTATLSPARFARYVGEEGLSNRVTPAKVQVRDVFSRSAKTIFAANDADWQHLQPVGLTLEIIPLKAPMAGATASFRVLYEGEPLAGTTLIGLSQRHPDRHIKAVTDAAGIARLQLGSDEGAWLFKTVHITKTAPREYRSFWSSLTIPASAQDRSMTR